MLPDIHIELLGKSIPIPTWNLFVGIGIASGFWLLDRQLSKAATNEREIGSIYNAIVVCLICGFISAHAFEILVKDRSPVDQAGQTGPVFSFHGFTFLGGFIGAVGSAALFLKLKRMNVVRVLNMAAPAIALGHACGRIGCFLAGCCYGKVICLAGYFFRVPTQLMEATFLFLLAIYLLVRAGRGQRMRTYLIAYGAWRFGVEFFRGDDRGSLLGSILSPSQIISLGLIIAGALLPAAKMKWSLLTIRNQKPS